MAYEIAFPKSLELERINISQEKSGSFMVVVIDNYGVYEIIGETDPLGHEITDIKVTHPSLSSAKVAEHNLSISFPQLTFIVLSV